MKVCICLVPLQVLLKYLAITINPIHHISCWRVDTVYGRSPWATVRMILVEAPSGLVPNCGPTTPVYITTLICEHCIRVCSIGNHNPLEGVCLCRIRSEENSNLNNNKKIMPGSGIIYHISFCYLFSELKYNLSLYPVLYTGRKSVSLFLLLFVSMFGHIFLWSDTGATTFVFTARPKFGVATILGWRLYLWKAHRHKWLQNKVCTSDTVATVRRCQ